MKINMIIKTLVSLIIILTASWIGKKVPTLAGLIGVMPLTGVLVMICLYIDSKSDIQILKEYNKGAIWGIIPTILFFVAVYFSLKKGINFPFSMAIGFFVWSIGAFTHQAILR
ncbi:MAG: DUF3147 family protein [Candidatus Omnitrophica bacterium]|nr:DUF3147 family protein [Candidatus Omnitrophota bacterium]